VRGEGEGGRGEKDNERVEGGEEREVEGCRFQQFRVCRVCRCVGGCIWMWEREGVQV